MTEIVDRRVPAIEARRNGWAELTIEEATALIRSHAWTRDRDRMRCASCGAGPKSALIGCTDSPEVQARRRAAMQRNLRESEWTWKQTQAR